MMIEKHVELVLEELESFFNVVLILIKDFYQSKDAADERDSLIEYTIERIDLALLEHIIELPDQINFLKKIRNRLEGYFQFGDVIDSTYRNNLKTYGRSPGKYNHRDYLNEMTTLNNRFTAEVNYTAQKNHIILKQNFDREEYKLAKIKLPYTDINESELSIILEEIKRDGNWHKVVNNIILGNWQNIASDDIKFYLNKILIYDIGCIKSSMLWEILSHVLLKIEILELAKLTFSDLFNNVEDYENIRHVFESNGIIMEDGSSMGVIVDGSIEKHTVASLIAIAQVLDGLQFFKQQYTSSEQVRIMAGTFNMKASKASLTKKSPYHLQMVNRVYNILNR